MGFSSVMVAAFTATTAPLFRCLPLNTSENAPRPNNCLSLISYSKKDKGEERSKDGRKPRACPKEDQLGDMQKACRRRGVGDQERENHSKQRMIKAKAGGARRDERTSDLWWNLLTLCSLLFKLIARKHGCRRRRRRRRRRQKKMKKKKKREADV